MPSKCCQKHSSGGIIHFYLNVWMVVRYFKLKWLKRVFTVWPHCQRQAPAPRPSAHRPLLVLVSGVSLPSILDVETNTHNSGFLALCLWSVSGPLAAPRFCVLLMIRLPRRPFQNSTCCLVLQKHVLIFFFKQFVQKMLFFFILQKDGKWEISLPFSSVPS